MFQISGGSEYAFGSDRNFFAEHAKQRKVLKILLAGISETVM